MTSKPVEAHPTDTMATPRDSRDMLANLLVIAEVDRAVENLMKSGKMFGQPGARRESLQQPSPSKRLPDTGTSTGTSTRVWPESAFTPSC